MSEEAFATDAVSNREVWDGRHSGWFAGRAERQWAAEPHWGLWEVPESELRLLADISDRDVIDLGCGTGYIGAWVARAGGRPVGIDNSAAQLATARAMQDQHNLRFPLIHANAERVPLSDSCFDVAISEHGASAWCDPHRWIPEAARLLRPGGRLIFMRNSTLLAMCLASSGPAGTRLTRPYTSLPRLEEADGAVTYQLPTGPMISLLRDCGLDVDELVELIVPADTRSDFDYVDSFWAAQWPSEEVWKATKTGQRR